jgi:hypothetical protein
MVADWLQLIFKTIVVNTYTMHHRIIAPHETIIVRRSLAQPATTAFI